MWTIFDSYIAVSSKIRLETMMSYKPVRVTIVSDNLNWANIGEDLLVTNYISVNNSAYADKGRFIYFVHTDNIIGEWNE